MRVISGEFGSRPLKAVPGKGTRPTSDKIKESIFNLIGGYFSGGNCLDFYGGSGAIGIEAVSRGMDTAVICEQSQTAIKTINQNIEMTQAQEQFVVLKGNNRVTLKRWMSEQANLAFDLIFIDPPYADERIVDDIQWMIKQGIHNSETMIVCETDVQHSLPERIGNLEKWKYKEYGMTAIHIYLRNEDK